MSFAHAGAESALHERIAQLILEKCPALGPRAYPNGERNFDAKRELSGLTGAITVCQVSTRNGSSLMTVSLRSG